MTCNHTDTSEADAKAATQPKPLTPHAVVEEFQNVKDLLTSVVSFTDTGAGIM